jgi:8-oxo-dGTP diphosphatase
MKPIIKPKDGAKVIIFSLDKILLFHRDDIPTIPFPGCWQLVGGGIEEGETPEQALLREVKEETSYDLKKFKLITETIGSNGENAWIYATYVDKEERAKFIIGPGEGQEIGWFTFEEAFKLKLTPGSRRLFLEYRELGKK